MEKLVYNWPGERIDKYLSTVFPYSRSFFEHIISRNGISVESAKCKIQNAKLPSHVNNSKPVKKSYKLKPWDRVQIDNLERYLWSEVLDEAPNIDIPVLKETDDYLVIRKPKWVLSHPNSVWDVAKPSVVGFLYHRYKDLPSVGNFVRAGLIHRLDKDTDGLMILVKTEKGLAHFKKLFQAKSESKTIEEKESIPLKKFYRATCGLTPEGKKFLSEIKKKLPYIIEEEVVPKVTPCVPKMGISKIISASPTPNPFSQMWDETVDVEVEILTGRTHQIRYHLSQHGLPIVGDKLYGLDNVKNEEMEMMLTAWRLVFEGVGGERVEVEIS